MSDNRVISGAKYTVNSVSRTTKVNDDFTKRTYTSNNANSNSQNHNNSNSFKDNLKSHKHDLEKDNSEELAHELDNKLRLQSEENSRIVQSKFRETSNTVTHQNINPPDNTERILLNKELHKKLSEPIDVQIDATDLTKKIELLKALKHE